MGIFHACMHVQNVQVWRSQRPEVGSMYPEIGITGGYEPPCEYWVEPRSCGRATRTLDPWARRDRGPLHINKGSNSSRGLTVVNIYAPKLHTLKKQTP